MRLTKTIKFSYGEDGKVIRFRLYYVYKTIMPAINKPNYFLSKAIIKSKNEDMIGGPKTYNLICDMNGYHNLGYFLDTWREVLLQAELDFVSELFAESQMRVPKGLRCETDTLVEDDAEE